MGVWPAGVGPTGRLFWAAGGALGALEGHGPQPVCIFVDSALPAHAVGCSVRVSCSTNFLLHEGMRVVFVARCLFPTFRPPKYMLYTLQISDEQITSVKWHPA